MVWHHLLAHWQCVDEDEVAMLLLLLLLQLGVCDMMWEWEAVTLQVKRRQHIGLMEVLAACTAVVLLLELGLEVVVVVAVSGAQSDEARGNGRQQRLEEVVKAVRGQRAVALLLCGAFAQRRGAPWMTIHWLQALTRCSAVHRQGIDLHR